MSEWIPEDSEAEFVSPLAAITSPMEAPKNSNVSNGRFQVLGGGHCDVVRSCRHVDEVGRQEILLHSK